MGKVSPSDEGETERDTIRLVGSENCGTFVIAFGDGFWNRFEVPIAVIATTDVRN